MPTQRKRHQVTETDELSRALDEASKLWPGETRGMLLSRILRAGGATVVAQQSGAARKRLAALGRVSGSFTGAFGPGYLEDLRQDWPE
jgi:hypothetical protein